MTYRLSAGVCSDIGGFRSTNQDAAFAAPWAAAVADGVGGGPAGDLASAALIHGLIAAGDHISDAAELASRVRTTNWDIGAHVRHNPELRGMATTFTGLWFAADGTLLLAHTGDSRAYLLRGGALTRETRDDSYVQVLVDRGLLSAEDAYTHPRRNLITASLRGQAGDPVSVSARDCRDGDRWLLCSDGVSDYVPEPDLATLVAATRDPIRAARRIVAYALRAGSRDNVTAVVCDLVATPTPAGAIPVVAGSAAARFTEVVEDGLVASA